MVIIISVILLIIALFFGFLYIIFYSSFGTLHKKYNPQFTLPRSKQFDNVRNEIKERVKKLDSLKYKEVTVSSYDKLTLFGRLYEAENKNTVILQMHGYRGHGLKDFCGSTFYWMNRNYTLLIPDQRAHGKSGGHSITFGIKERYDVLTWVNFITQLYGKDVKIILSGISMGAATVLMASELALPENVKGIIADCPYSSPKEIIKKVAKERGFPPVIFYPVIKLAAKLFGKFDIEQASPMQAVKQTKLPILIIHGNDDRFVPYEMGKSIYDSYGGKKKMLTVNGAGHAFAYFFSHEQYENTLDEFVRDIL